MEKYVNIELPLDLDGLVVDEIKADLKNIAEIEEVGSGDARAVDPESILVWVSLITTVVTSIDKAIPVFTKIKSLFKQKGIKGVKITRSDGTIIEMDHASSEEIVALLKEE